MPRQFTSPVMRMVQGDLFTPNLTDQAGKPRLVLSGPRAGQPSPQWFIAMAIAKTDPAWPAFKMLIDTESAEDWPSLFPQGAAGPCVLPSFSNKVIDGDGYDQSGKHNATKDGMAGHWVVKFASGFAPKVFAAGHYAPHEQITDPLLARRGWFYRVVGSMDTNNQPQKPGIYMNTAGVEVCGHGPEIVSGPDFAAAFGGAGPPVLPAGASATPVAGPPLHTPGVYVPPPVAPAAPYTPPMQAPPVAPAMPPPPPGPAHVMTPKAAGATYESHIAAGWTDATLIQHGLMLPPAA